MDKILQLIKKGGKPTIKWTGIIDYSACYREELYYFAIGDLRFYDLRFATSKVSCCVVKPQSAGHRQKLCDLTLLLVYFRYLFANCRIVNVSLHGCP